MGSPFHVLEYVNLARVCFLPLSRKQNARILKQRTPNQVICSGVKAHLWERERCLLHVPGHCTCLVYVRQKHLDSFKQSHQHGQVYIRRFKMSKFIIVYLNWALLNFCERSYKKHVSRQGIFFPVKGMLPTLGNLR